MNTEVAKWLMHHLENNRPKRELWIGKVSDDVAKWLNDIELPSDLLRFLKHYWPRKKCVLGPIMCMPMADLDDDLIDPFLEVRLFPVGTAANGDTFVIDYSLESCPVGFVSHEGCFDEKKTSLRDVYVPVCRSVESFIFRVVENRFIPIDYHIAEGFNQFLQEEAEHEQFPPFRRKPEL